MSDQQKKLVRRGGGGTTSANMTVIEEPPSSLNSREHAGSNGPSSETDEFLSSSSPPSSSGGDGKQAAKVVGIVPRDAESDLTSSSNAQKGEQLLKPLSIDERYEAGRQSAKVRHWRDSPYAVGLVEVTWRDELSRRRRGGGDDDDDLLDDANGGVCAECCSDDVEPTCGCLLLSGVVCSRIGAGRVGNMAVLRESTVWVEREDDDGEGGTSSGDGGDEEEQMESEHGGPSAGGSSSSKGGGGGGRTRVRKTKIDLVVGPYWPMLLFVTYPLIFGISFWTAVSAMPHSHPLVTLIWAVLTFGLIYSLFSVGCRDPGILPKYRDVPRDVPRGEWRWSDQAQTYRPRGAIYDTDCAAVIEDFDHTCPWTGTAIGKANMPAFQAFVALVFICLIMDIFLLTGAF